MDLETTLRSAGQDHLWEHYIELRDDQQRDVFATELASIDWVELAKAFKKSMEGAAQQYRAGDDDLILPLEDVHTIQVGGWLGWMDYKPIEEQISCPAT